MRIKRKIKALKKCCAKFVNICQKLMLFCHPPVPITHRVIFFRGHDDIYTEIKIDLLSPVPDQCDIDVGR
jgi:hypothetical protein